MFLKEVFARHLSQLRCRCGISQSELAKQLDVGRTAVAMMETGQRGASLEVTCALADYFCVPVDFFLGRPPFDDWENVQKCRCAVVEATADIFGLETEWLNALPEPEFIRIFGALYARAVAHPDENTVELYPLIPPEHFGQS